MPTIEVGLNDQIEDKFGVFDDSDKIIYTEGNVQLSVSGHKYNSDEYEYINIKIEILVDDQNNKSGDVSDS